MKIGTYRYQIKSATAIMCTPTNVRQREKVMSRRTIIVATEKKTTFCPKYKRCLSVDSSSFDKKAGNRDFLEPIYIDQKYYPDRIPTKYKALVEK